MDRRSQVQPMVHEPARRDPRVLQPQPDHHLPQQLLTRATATESRRSAPTGDEYRPSQEPGYNVNGRRISISSPLSGKEPLPQNGEGGTTWQRRRRNRGQEQQPFDEVPSPDEVPAAPDVPRVRPPVSYQRPFVDTVAPAARHGSSRSFSARARSLQQEAYSPTLCGPADQSVSPGEHEVARPHPRSFSDSSTLSYVQIRPTISASYSSSSGNPAHPIGHSGSLSLGQNVTVASPLSRSNTRKESTSTTGSRNWASDRSPLQKLEVKLSDISKEEKRARVQEAEQRLKDSKAGRGNRRPSQRGASPSEPPPPRRVSRGMSKGSEKPMLHDVRGTEAGSLRRDIDTETGRRVTMTDRAAMRVGDPSRQSPDTSKSYDEGGADRLNDTRNRVELQYGQSMDSPITVNSSEPHYGDTERSVPFQDQHRQANFSDQGAWPQGGATAQRRTYPDATARPPSGTVSGHGVPVMIGRNGSRRFQKEQPLVQVSKQSYGDQTKPTDEPYSVPSPIIQNPRKQSVGYEQLQTAGTQRPRQTTEFGDGGYERIESLSHEKHHLSNLLHRGKRSPSMPLETHRVGPRRLDEWRGGKTARLTALDFLMEPQDAALKQPWWERKSQGHKRGNKAQQSSDRDRSFENENGTRSLIFFLQ